MKKIFIPLLLSLCLACSKDEGTSKKGKHNGRTLEKGERVCGQYNGKTLYTGPRGGCYYYQDDGEKTYVDRSNCSCLK
jgi:hypothetical protein